MEPAVVVLAIWSELEGCALGVAEVEPAATEPGAAWVVSVLVEGAAAVLLDPLAPALAAVASEAGVAGAAAPDGLMLEAVQ